MDAFQNYMLDFEGSVHHIWRMQQTRLGDGRDSSPLLKKVPLRCQNHQEVDRLLRGYGQQPLESQRNSLTHTPQWTARMLPQQFKGLAPPFWVSSRALSHCDNTTQRHKFGWCITHYSLPLIAHEIT